MTKEDQYDRRKQHHDLGAVLVAAVFEAMIRIFERKTRSLRKLLSISPGAQVQVTELLAVEACDLASHFINIVIRAIDYCPPVDLTFGEFLRIAVQSLEDGVILIARAPHAVLTEGGDRPVPTNCL